MSPTLPLQPNLEHLKKQAKELLRAHQSGQASACGTLRRLRGLAHASDAEILAAPFSLHQAQHALAKSYGFANWAALKEAVKALGDQTEFVVPRTALTEIATATVKRSGRRTWLEPIPRYPWEVEYVDGAGKTVRVERERAGRLLGNLYAGMRMQDPSVTWEQVAAASGECFRFTFEENWAQDAEYVTHVDAFANACETLGFSYESTTNEDRPAAMAAIDAALERGQSAVVGMVSRFWRLIVGIDRDLGQYYSIGGVRFEGWDSTRVPEREQASQQLLLEECLTIPVPEEDWHNATLTPEQAARNPVFVPGPRKPPAPREAVRRTLSLALEIHAPRIIQRRNLEYRRKAIDMGPPGHDGWKFYYSPWPGEFVAGSDAVRSWAETIARMKEPSNNFEMIHGNSVTFGIQLRKMNDAAAYLGWAAQQLPHPARGHLLSARRLFREAAAVDLRMLVRWRTCYEGNLDYPKQEETREGLLRRIEAEPALVYLISETHRQLLGDLAADAHGSPWGYRLLPGRETFERAKAAAVASLLRIAELRDQAFGEIDKALHAV